MTPLGCFKLFCESLWMAHSENRTLGRFKLFCESLWTAHSGNRTLGCLSQSVSLSGRHTVGVEHQAVLSQSVSLSGRHTAGVEHALFEIFCSIFVRIIDSSICSRLAFNPSSGKLCAQHMVIDHMNAHYKKLLNAKRTYFLVLTCG